MRTEDGPVYWISDAHLGSDPDPEGREALLVRFLAELQGRAARLYVLGDLFDFWFEYRHAAPKGHFRTLHALAGLIDQGTPVTYLGGNHDFWCGTTLEREVGLTVHQRPISVSHQGRRIFLAHGDGLGPGDAGYRLLKAVLRNPLAIALYRTIHPDIGIALARRVSATSRRHTKPREFHLRRMSRHVAAPEFARGHDAVILGHIHDPLHLRDARGRDCLLIGDWIEAFTFVELAEGRFTLRRYGPEGPAAMIPPKAWPEGMEP
ncbi:MAG: UDP-2,3-diacylglucosamine diphosphatase [Candidatus Eisenbacteria bacterium]|uniref:UDP-2,3-diacylglucosamine diphosphatase n=1 Tax=Eiseniibacteriota bacterium TaxID=2212470 RepID=A0A938BRZ8_UNCEI|nr:UDP-2,3-diacylglucosamine diphosphatase [Candidatus Eisenbacteria bacterium]